MKIIIAGAGKVGTALLRGLLTEDHDITVVDSSPAVIEEITNIYDVMCVCGNVTDCDTLTEAGVQDAELFIGVTGSDELNMLACLFARRMGTKHTIARVRRTEYSQKSLTFMRQQLDLSMTVNPELMTANDIFNILKLPHASKIEYFNRRSFEMVEQTIRPESPLCGTLTELRKKYDPNFLIAVVQRGEEVIIPDGSFCLQAGDRACIAATPTEMNRLMGRLHLLQHSAKNVMIVGGSRICAYLAKLLLSGGSSVTVVERDHDKSVLLSEQLKGARVICADGAQQEVLLEEGLDSMDAFIALTGIDEENILLAYYAQTRGVNKVIAKVNRDEFYPLASGLGLDCLVSSKNTVAAQIMRYARALRNSLGSNMETLYRLFEGQAEAAEFKVSQDFPRMNIPLKELKLRSGILIVGIIRRRKPIMPTGDDTIQSGDSVIVVSAGTAMKNLSDILQ